MTGRERFKLIMDRKSDSTGFWHGHTGAERGEVFYSHFGVENDLELGYKLGDTLAWIQLEEYGLWQHPDNVAMMDVLGGKTRHSLNQDGVFADCDNVAEVERFHWPDIKYCDFTIAEQTVEKSLSRGHAVLSGVWAPFFHNVCDFFGMENYFTMMYENPAVVQAVTEHVVDFYLRVNKRWFELIGDRMDAVFFGSDFGSQLDLLISPEMFDKFVLPYFQMITGQAKNSGYKVVLHSCGSIERVIPKLIDAGVDALHPIQARARNMDAETLARKYGEKVIFIGGVDAQGILPFGTPEQIRNEVHRLKNLFGPNYIVSPSHEELLPNIPPENILAMAEASV